MADLPVTTVPPTTEEGFYADRQKFWGSFTSLVTTATTGIVILLIGMAVFLL